MTGPEAESRGPRITVVMPAYNAERYVAAAVRSALDGGEALIEVLVVDDGSTDRTVAVVRAIDDPRVSVIPISASGGPARPRNVALSHARAPYLAMLDSDDVLKPGWLAASADALDRYPAAGFAFGDFERMDADGDVFEMSASYAYPVFQGLKSEPAGEDWRLIPQSELIRGLLYGNFIGTSSVVMRRELVTTLGGFDESLKNADDVDLWYRLAHRCGALYCSRVAYSYRVLANSVARGPPLRTALTRIQVLRRERARWHDREARKQLNRRIAENFAGIGYQQRLHGERWPAVRSYLRAYATSPQSRWLTYLIAALLFARDGDGSTSER
jgi:glycosyltransferase involved in cell wall biosynthesis